MSDGELDEGQSWEAVLLASKEKLGNLIAIVDRNNIQIDGYTEDVMPLGSVVHKFESFGWHVEEIDGHNFSEIIAAVGRAKAVFDGRPLTLRARRSKSWLRSWRSFWAALIYRRPTSGPGGARPSKKQQEKSEVNEGKLFTITYAVYKLHI